MSIAVLDRAFTILEILARNERPLALAELAEEGRLPKPTVHRILRSLRDLGYVGQAARKGTYELSGRLGSLREAGRDAAIQQAVMPLMRRLHLMFDETVNLGLLEGLTVRYAHVIETTQSLRWIVKPGARDRFHTTALGRAIVAQFPAEQRTRLVAKACATLPVRKRAAARAALEKELSTTRARGFACEEEETTAGVACVAIPLTSYGEPLAALSVAVPVQRFSRQLKEALLGEMMHPGERTLAHG